MLETFVEFTFEAAHQIPPYSGMHGHSFKVVVYLNGKPDPVFGWTHNLYDVEAAVRRRSGNWITVTSTRSKDWKSRAWKTSPIGYGTDWIRSLPGWIA